MARQYYLPDLDSKRVVWLNNFAAQLPKHAAALNINAETLLYVQEAAIYFEKLNSTIHKLKANLSAIIKHRDIHSRGTRKTAVSDVLPAINVAALSSNFSKPIFTNIKQIVKVLRNHPNYTHSIGVSLQIIGPEIDTSHYNEVVPEFRVNVTAEYVVIQWKKRRFTGIDVYVDKGRGNGYEYVGFEAQPPFEYAIKLLPDVISELWIFKLIYRLGNKQVGRFSQPVSIIVTPPLKL